MSADQTPGKPPEEPVNRLWTTWAMYHATGEGVYFGCRITYAHDKAEAVLKFQEAFGAFYALGCEAEPGVSDNELVRRFVAQEVLEDARDNDRRADVDIKFSWYLNLA